MNSPTRCYFKDQATRDRANHLKFLLKQVPFLSQIETPVEPLNTAANGVKTSTPLDT